MKFKGIYDEKAKYEINDVVLYDDGNAYRLNIPCEKCIPPIDTAYWNKLNPVLGQCAQLIVSFEKPGKVAEEKKPVAAEEAPKPRTRKGANKA